MGLLELKCVLKRSYHGKHVLLEENVWFWCTVQILQLLSFSHPSEIFCIIIIISISDILSGLLGRKYDPFKEKWASFCWWWFWSCVFNSLDSGIFFPEGCSNRFWPCSCAVAAFYFLQLLSFFFWDSACKHIWYFFYLIKGNKLHALLAVSIIIIIHFFPLHAGHMVYRVYLVSYRQLWSWGL